MSICYHKEVFIPGFVVAYMTFAVFVLFGDVIREWIGKVRKLSV